MQNLSTSPRETGASFGAIDNYYLTNYRKSMLNNNLENILMQRGLR